MDGVLYVEIGTENEARRVAAGRIAAILGISPGEAHQLVDAIQMTTVDQVYLAADEHRVLPG